MSRRPEDRKTVEIPVEPQPTLEHSVPLPAGYYLVSEVERMAAAREPYEDWLARLAAEVEVVGAASPWATNLQAHAEGRLETLQLQILGASRTEPQRVAWTRQLVAVALVLGVVARALRGWA